MNSNHKITQWNTCIVLYYLVVLLFNIYYFIYIIKIPQKAGKFCLPTPILISIVEVSLRAVKIK